MARGVLAGVVLAIGTAVGCASDEPRADTDGGACVPGQQVSCACPGGGAGVQICAQDGAQLGPCMGCEDGTSGAATTLAEETSAASTGTTIASTSSTTTGDDETTGMPADSSSGGATFAWVWVDHGGPAFSPPPCGATAGVVDGLLVDPQAFFTALVEGTDPNDWETVMNAIEPELWACGLGQQRGSGGNVRGRLFLPTEPCPNAAPPPDDPEAMFLGVRQERACWQHFVDVVAEQ